MMQSFSRRQFLGQAAAGAAVAMLPFEAGAAPRTPQRVVLVTIDTIRADHLPMYGYPRNTSPFLAELATQSVLFEQALCTCSHTNPSHLSILSGLHPPQHKLHTNIEDRFNADIRMASQMFQDQGFATAAICSVLWLKILNRGFDHMVYCDRPADHAAPYYDAATAVNLAVEWLEAQAPEAPFFLWLHLFDPHRPMRPPEPHLQAMRSEGETRGALLRHWRETQKKTLEFWEGDEAAFAAENDAYDAEMHFVDAELRRLYAWMAQSRRNEDCLWVITGDHGEGLGSHGYRDHGLYIYQEQLLVPLLFHLPGLAPRRIPGMVSLVDLAPTFADWFGWAGEWQAAPLPGQSLLPLITGELRRLPPRYHFAQRQHRYLHGYTTQWEADPVYCLLNEQYKFIVHANGQHEFYDLQRDPQEQTNRVAEDSLIARHLERAAREEFARLEASAASLAGPQYTDEYEDFLKTLGYL